MMGNEVQLLEIILVNYFGCNGKAKSYFDQLALGVTIDFKATLIKKIVELMDL